MMLAEGSEEKVVAGRLRNYFKNINNICLILRPFMLVFCSVGVNGVALNQYHRMEKRSIVLTFLKQFKSLEEMNPYLILNLGLI